MGKYQTTEDLASAVDWEGGLMDFVLGYGLSLDDLPDDTPPRIRAAFGQLQDCEPAVREIERWLGL